MGEQDVHDKGKPVTDDVALVPEVNRALEQEAAPQPTPGGEPEGDTAPLAIASIGASAGGLKPLCEFFDAMPADTGLAFVVVQHLLPHSPSMLPDLLGRHTTMDVRQAEEGTRVAPNVVYVIPPGHGLELKGDLLHLQPREGPEHLHLPIDRFFRSLAEHRGEAAIGIVLSGSGADGALGLRAVKERGGLAIVQAPDTAEQAGMPRSAIETGLVDYILPPADMPPLLLTYAAHVREERQVPPGFGTDAARAAKWILTIVSARTGHDFSLYKQSTIQRRIRRRMLLRQIDELDEYARFLNRNPDEVHALFQELLIGVTEFFRDPEAFEALEAKVLPALLDGWQGRDPLRVWVPACSTGEEAYSIAILIREYLDRRTLQIPVQVFGTDVDEEAIARARRGSYPATIAACVSPERLERFFVREDDTYQVVEAVRKMIVFAPQSLVKDPPFSRLDLVSCRNLLIYLEPALQNVVLSTLTYALKPGGFLFLGSSEAPAGSRTHFQAVDRKWRIYRRLAGRPELPAMATSPDLLAAQAGSPLLPPLPRQSATRQLVERTLLENHLPPSLVVNQEGEILFVYGRTGRYLEPAAGEVGPWHVVRMLRKGLRMALMAALRETAATGETVREEGLRLDLEGHNALVDVIVQPLDPFVSIKGLFLVTFQEPRPALPAGAGPLPGAGIGPSKREAELERELQATREYLQATIEELQSSNEEIQSTNEELQSANEELQTAQEEALSINEELSTLNNQLETKVTELQEANDDMSNLLASIDVGIIFLDRRFRVRRFNQSATRMVNLLASDLGRPIEHISSSLGGTDWVAAARRVFEQLVTHQEEVQSQDGEWYWMRIQPYRTAEDAIDGVVLTFTDITQHKAVEQALRRTQAFAAEIVDTVRQPLVVLDADLRVKQANRAFYETFRLDTGTTKGRLLYDLADRQWNIPRLRELLEEIIPRNATFEGFEVEHDFQDLGRRRMILNARRLDAGNERPDLILLAIEEGE
jgi:two-component system CheB/CheR fusion protein